MERFYFVVGFNRKSLKCSELTTYIFNHMFHITKLMAVDAVQGSLDEYGDFKLTDF